MSRIWNKGSVLAKHYKLRVLIPTIVGKANLWKEDLIVQEVDGFKFWRISLGNARSYPLFPDDDVIADHEIPLVFQSVPEPTSDFLLCTLFADEMPPLKRKIPVVAALNDWA
jgi:hypothetical protein